MVWGRGKMIKYILLTLILSVCILPSLGSGQPTQAQEKQVFTWISNEIDNSTAEWLYNMNFTDVCVRYVSAFECNESKNSLSVYGLNLWKLFTPDDLKDKTETEMVNILQWYVDLSPSHKIVIDDCHFLIDNMPNLLAAISQVTNGQILLTFYAPDFANCHNFTNVNLDLYMTPYDLNTTLIGSLRNTTSSLGIYLWLWQGHGVSWQTINQIDIAKVYQTAQKYDIDRLTVWMGNESDLTEKGMWNSSLMNFPKWWPIINECNWKFKQGLIDAPIRDNGTVYNETLGNCPNITLVVGGVIDPPSPEPPIIPEIPLSSILTLMVSTGIIYFAQKIVRRKRNE